LSSYQIFITVQKDSNISLLWTWNSVPTHFNQIQSNHFNQIQSSKRALCSSKQECFPKE